MKTIVCDVCKRVIQQPEHERNYFHIARRDICVSCKDQMDLILKPVLGTKQPFTYEWFNQTRQDMLEKAIGRGKFETPK